MHGYQIIRELGERSGGVWTPSPGSVYPTLQLLEEEGLVQGEDREGKKTFTLTDTGRAAHAARPAGPAPCRRWVRTLTTPSSRSATSSAKWPPPSARLPTPVRRHRWQQPSPSWPTPSDPSIGSWPTTLAIRRRDDRRPQAGGAQRHDGETVARSCWGGPP